MPHLEPGQTNVTRPSLDVGTFVKERCGVGLDFTVLAGHAGLKNRIEVGRIQKLSLALAGYTQQIRKGRLQIVGETEISYASSLEPERRRTVFEEACKVPVTAFLITKGLSAPSELLDAAEKHAVPVLWCGERSSSVIDTVQRYLEERLAPRVRIHGTLLEVFGLGVLIQGESGIGKSECALEMIQRGHRLVADDVVEVRVLSQQVLMGMGTEALRHHMELRGIGIVNIKDLFGVAAVRNRKRIELIVRLIRWDDSIQYDRLGLDERRTTLLSADVPYMEMPVASGRNVAILLEVAARHSMLRRSGYNPARDLVDRLDRDLLDCSGDDE